MQKIKCDRCRDILAIIETGRIKKNLVVVCGKCLAPRGGNKWSDVADFLQGMMRGK